MNDTTAPLTQSPGFWQKVRAGNKYPLLLIGIIILLIVTVIIYIGGTGVGQPPAPIPAPSGAPTPYLTGSRVEDQILLKFRPGVSQATISQTLKKYNATIIKRIDAIRIIVIQVPEGQEDAILEQMKKDNLIESAEPDYILKTLQAPYNDPALNIQWSLKNTGQVMKGRPVDTKCTGDSPYIDKKGTAGDDIKAYGAWDVTRGKEVKVAVLDTGIDTTHPDLSSKIIAQKDFSGGSTVKDGFGHGTHVAGIIAASTGNSEGMAGVCPGCKLIIAKVMNDWGMGADSSIIDGIIWAADSGAHVINMSLGITQESSARQDAINYAWNKGAVIVAAAGNNGTGDKFYPAASNNVVSVAATDNNDRKTCFSEYGTWVDVAAPGEAIYSTLPTYPFYIQQLKSGIKNNYDYLDGTSMASPVAAGVVGLIWASSYGKSNTAVVQRLFDTVDKISGTGTYWANGRVNAAQAVSGGASVSPNPTNITPTPSAVTPTLEISPGVTSIPTTVTPTPTCTPGTVCVSPTPTPAYVTPTVYCIGSCPTIPPTPTPTQTVIPSTTGSPSNQPSPSPTSAPCDAITPTGGAVPTTTPSPAPDGGNIFEIIKKIIEDILKLIGLK